MVGGESGIQRLLYLFFMEAPRSIHSICSCIVPFIGHIFYCLRTLWSFLLHQQLLLLIDLNGAFFAICYSSMGPLFVQVIG